VLVLQVAHQDLSQTTLPRRLPALNQLQPECFVAGVASRSGKATAFISPSPEQVCTGHPGLLDDARSPRMSQVSDPLWPEYEGYVESLWQRLCAPEAVEHASIMDANPVAPERVISDEMLFHLDEIALGTM
jgi:hypothetical protein